jgi:rod shape-determining protein MreC
VARPSRIDPRPFLKLALALVIWWASPPVVRSLFKDGVYELQAPFISAQSHIEDLGRYWEQRLLRTKEGMMAAVRDLSRANQALNLENHELLAYRVENERLRRLLDLPPRAEYRMLVARVARRDLNAWWSRVTLRRGAADGVVAGVPVVAGENVVGRVIKVHLHTCEVQLVSDPAFRISASLDGTERAAVYQGTVNRPFDPPRGIIHNIPADYNFRPDNGGMVSVFTSGAGGIFPAALRIGTFDVSTLQQGENGLFLMADVELLPELCSMEEVSILLPIAPPPLEPSLK